MDAGAAGSLGGAAGGTAGGGAAAMGGDLAGSGSGAAMEPGMAHAVQAPPPPPPPAPKPSDGIPYQGSGTGRTDSGDRGLIDRFLEHHKRATALHGTAESALSPGTADTSGVRAEGLGLKHSE